MESELINRLSVFEKNEIFAHVDFFTYSKYLLFETQKIRYINFKQHEILSLKKAVIIIGKIKQILKKAPALFVRAGPKYVNGP